MRGGIVAVGVLLGIAMYGDRVLAQDVEPDGEGGVESWSVAAGTEERGASWEIAKAGALGELARLGADIHLLSALWVLQTRLLEWNQQLAVSGAGLVSLEASLCEEPEVRVWCDLLPATFGRLEEEGG